MDRAKVIIKKRTTVLHHLCHIVTEYLLWEGSNFKYKLLGVEIRHSRLVVEIILKYSQVTRPLLSPKKLQTYFPGLLKNTTLWAVKCS